MRISFALIIYLTVVFVLLSILSISKLDMAAHEQHEDPTQLLDAPGARSTIPEEIADTTLWTPTVLCSAKDEFDNLMNPPQVEPEQEK